MYKCTVVDHRFGRRRKNSPSSNYNYTILQKDIENAMKHEKIALCFWFSKSSCMQWYMYEFIAYLGIEKKVPNFIEVISNFHRFRHPSHLGSAFKSWIKLHSIKAATTFLTMLGNLLFITLLLMKWNGSCSVQIYAKVRNFFFNLKICQEFDDILLHT